MESDKYVISPKEAEGGDKQKVNRMMRDFNKTMSIVILLITGLSAIVKGKM